MQALRDFCLLIADVLGALLGVCLPYVVHRQRLEEVNQNLQELLL